MKFSNIHLIINPVSGGGDPPTASIGSLLDQHGVGWTVHETSPDDRAEDLARQAVEAGADAVAVYGGDGTVVGSVSGLVDTGVPLIVLPGGTANVFAEELGIPNGWEAALGLATQEEPVVRDIDVGAITQGVKDDQYFLLQLSIGLGADLAGGTPDEEKERLGRFAYALSAWCAYRHQTVVRYEIEVDGEVHRAKGVYCCVCNSARTGVPGLLMHPDIAIDDRQIDVLVVERVGLRAITALVSRTLISFFHRKIPKFDPAEGVRHYTGQQIVINGDKPQKMAIDGDQIEGHFPIHTEVRAGALRVIVPPEESAFPFDLSPLLPDQEDDEEE